MRISLSSGTNKIDFGFRDKKYKRKKFLLFFPLNVMKNPKIKGKNFSGFLLKKVKMRGKMRITDSCLHAIVFLWRVQKVEKN